MSDGGELDGDDDGAEWSDDGGEAGGGADGDGRARSRTDEASARLALGCGAGVDGSGLPSLISQTIETVMATRYDGADGRGAAAPTPAPTAAARPATTARARGRRSTSCSRRSTA